MLLFAAMPRDTHNFKTAFCLPTITTKPTRAYNMMKLFQIALLSVAAVASATSDESQPQAQVPERSRRASILAGNIRGSNTNMEDRMFNDRALYTDMSMSMASSTMMSMSMPPPSTLPPKGSKGGNAPGSKGAMLPKKKGSKAAGSSKGSKLTMAPGSKGAKGSKAPGSKGAKGSKATSSKGTKGSKAKGSKGSKTTSS
jgi:hypothetical protein